MSSLDTSQYMGLFLAEVEEQLTTLNQSILALEKSDTNEDVIQSLFRVAHTLKGSSATMGLDIMAELTHHLEDILDDVRHGLIKVSLPLIDTLFACLDQLQTWRDELAAGAVSLEPVPTLLERLERVRTVQEIAQEVVCDLTEVTLLPEVIQQSREYLNQGWWVGTVGVRIAKDSLMPAVRAYLALNNAREWGEILASAPDETILEEGEWQGHLILWMAIPGEGLSGLRTSLENLSEIDEVIFKPWENENNSFSVNFQTVSSDSNDSIGSVIVSPIIEESPDEIPENIKAASVEKNPEGKRETKQLPEGDNTSGSKKENHDFVRIEVSRLDALMNLLGELVIDRARLNQIEQELESLGGETIESLSEVSRHISLVSGELQERLLKLRMSPMSQVYARFPRMVRDLAHQLGKEVEFELIGEETELDRSVIQNIAEPLVHLIRNSLDHGLESPEERRKAGKLPQGRLVLTTEQMGGEIHISVKDDGKGIDPERLREIGVQRGFVTAQEARSAKDIDVLQWIFQSGFSTRKEVSEVSGRGVGMDVVKHAVEQMHGRVEIESVVGEGTLISITVPLTLAVIRALLVDVNGHPYTIPLANVLETLRLKEEEIYDMGNRSAIVVRGRTIPVISMPQWCGVPGSEEDENKDDKNIAVVLVASGNKQAGLIVKRFIGEQEVVVKPLGRYLGNSEGFAGATLLGDGRVSLIFDVPSLLRGVEIFTRA